LKESGLKVDVALARPKERLPRLPDEPLKMDIKIVVAWVVMIPSRRPCVGMVGSKVRLVLFQQAKKTILPKAWIFPTT